LRIEDCIEQKRSAIDKSNIFKCGSVDCICAYSDLSIFKTQYSQVHVVLWTMWLHRDHITLVTEGHNIDLGRNIKN
jgi:hypothetical protein